MNIYIKRFLQRGFAFAGFGPVVVGTIYLIVDMTTDQLVIRGTQVCLAIISSYLLAFVHAGASVFVQIEEWPLLKTTTFHFLTLYLAYTVCYLINTWIPFNIKVLIIYTLFFVFSYFAIWISVVISIKLVSKKMNKKLGDMEK